MMKMKFRKDILPWHNIYILQATEENVIEELSYDKKGNKKTLPRPEKIREIVLDRIKEMKGETIDEQI